MSKLFIIYIECILLVDLSGVSFVDFRTLKLIKNFCVYEYAYGNECFVHTNVFSQGGEIVEQIRPNIRTAQCGSGSPDQTIKVNANPLPNVQPRSIFQILYAFFCHIS